MKLSRRALLSLFALTSSPVWADGIVTVYSADGLHDGDNSWYQHQFAAFTKATGIKVQYVEGGSGAIVERLAKERTNPQADVLVTVPPFIQRAAKEQLLAEFQPQDSARIPGVRDSYSPLVNNYLTFIYNSKLLDEPLSALDAQIRHNMVEEIARLHRELPELTILYVTHDQTEALTLADKIGIMKDGSLIAHGETHQLYHYPPNRFSAEFLGRANILQATALTDTAGPGLVSVSCGGGLIATFSRGGQHGNNKLLCIRPQHMSLAPRSATSNRLNAILTSVHWQGDLTHLLCDVAGEAVRIVMTHVNPLPRAGDRLALYFEPNDAVLIEVS